jgi:hypothetical protein
MRKSLAVVFVSVVALGLVTFNVAEAHNCGGWVYCGYSDANWNGSRIFAKDIVNFGQQYEFTDDVMSSVANHGSGVRLCLMEKVTLGPDYPWIGVPQGVHFDHLSDFGVNDVADYIEPIANSAPCSEA